MLIRSFRYSPDWNIVRLWKFSCLSDWWWWWCRWCDFHFCRILSCMSLIYGSDFSKLQIPKSLCNKRIFNRNSSSYFFSFFSISVCSIEWVNCFLPSLAANACGKHKSLKTTNLRSKLFEWNRHKKIIRALSAQFWAQFSSRACSVYTVITHGRWERDRKEVAFFRNGTKMT